MDVSKSDHLSSFWDTFFTKTKQIWGVPTYPKDEIIFDFSSHGWVVDMERREFL